MRNRENSKWHLIKRLQYLLTHSFYAKLLSVRTVTKNKGRRTAGIDGAKWITPNSGMNTALKLSDKEYKAKSLRRAYIPKPRTTNKRPLSTPTMYGYGVQALHAILTATNCRNALADPRSSGFGKYRSA